ncbi:hypothetical protein [Priestia filamentosa]|uniref:Uncharacterized protein n=3 Tax=Priestia filamentosa TaxID=1402861 RepID=A0A1X7E2B9_9BACI|nr:hypothetical protein [Priestia filamentosa]AKO92300.1 hypothetical protein BEH_09465 [Priestia filamentosa]MDT3762338.1 hypothetical protein [Priestia filamentosa]OXS68901.1 hypothetical protein B1B01_07880 [Priestia filamentosa]RJS64395.1 hypothetical protein CJ485_06435 [Priestia filamentosa]WCM17837.1 hypothetical protein PGN40_08690 [Priestia filamentosa]
MIKRLLVIFLSLFIIYVGVKIRKRERVDFIAGYNVIFKPRNEKKLAKRVGVLVMLFGIETIVFITLSLFLSNLVGFYGTLVVLNILFIGIFIIVDQLSNF